jgi:hypothetical protein
MHPESGPVTKRSAGVLAGEFIGRPARWCSGSWRRDAAKTRKRGRLRYFVNSVALEGSWGQGVIAWGGGKG